MPSASHQHLSVTITVLILYCMSVFPPLKDKDSSINILGEVLLINYSCLIDTTCTEDGRKEGSWPETLLEFDNEGPESKHS